MLIKKKGESLIEVVVALSILSFIFFGVVGIVAGSVTLNRSARQRTEAVAMVQKNLNEYLAGNTNQGACSITDRELGTVVGPIGASGCNLPGGITDNISTCFWIEAIDLSTDDPNETFPGSAGFIKVISHGKWYTRIIGEQNFEISRVIRNN